MVDRPDPNDAMETFQRGGAGTDDSLGIALMTRGMQESKAADWNDSQRSEKTNIGVYRDPRWVGVGQALKERGVDQLKTGATAGAMQGGGMDVLHSGEGDNLTAQIIGGAQPGFFDRPSMTALQQGRQNSANAFMANYGAGAYQDSRRR